MSAVPFSPYVMPAVIPHQYIPLVKPDDNMWELVFGTLLLASIIVLLIYKQNFTWLQKKGSLEEPDILEQSPNYRALFILFLVIAFVLLLVPPLIFRGG